MKRCTSSKDSTKGGDEQFRHEMTALDTSGSKGVERLRWTKKCLEKRAHRTWGRWDAEEQGEKGAGCLVCSVSEVEGEEAKKGQGPCTRSHSSQVIRIPGSHRAERGKRAGKWAAHLESNRGSPNESSL